MMKFDAIKKAKKRWWVVTGRVYGDDDDAAIVVEGDSQNDAVKHFVKELYNSDVDGGDVNSKYHSFEAYWNRRKHGRLRYESEEIYVIHIIDCGNHRPKEVQ